MRELDGLIREFEACTLPRREWTHQAHLVVALWYVTHHGAAAALEILRRRIRTYNEATSTQNTDTQGYHETLTRLYLKGIAELAARQENEPLPLQVAALLQSPLAERQWPLRFYSRDRLYSVEARRDWVEPDRAAAHEHPG
jgi:hypothetical protein